MGAITFKDYKEEFLSEAQNSMSLFIEPKSWRGKRNATEFQHCTFNFRCFFFQERLLAMLS